MNCENHRQQEDSRDLRKIMTIEDYFQDSREKKNATNICQIALEPRKRPREITNMQNQISHIPKKTRQDQTHLPNKTIITILGVNHKKYVLTHRETGSLYTALLTLKAVNEEIENQKGKEMLVCGTEGIKGYINLGMPLRCFPEGSQVLITFSKSARDEKEDNPVLGRNDQESTACVKFYIHAVEKRGKRILKCRELDKEENRLCVYGFKGETIKDTLQRDGRFLSFVQNDNWKLIQELDTIIENTQPVDELEGKLFHMEVELEKRNTYVLEEYIVEKYLSLLKEQEKMIAYIKKESEKRKEKTSLSKEHKKTFREQTKYCIPGQVLKLLSQFLDSVGLLFWDNRGNQGSATCFVFRGSFIFTSRHVINDIVGEQIEESEWAEIISQRARVTFDYDESPRREDNDIFFLEPWFEISDVTLDYAVLKLKENGQEVPMGLYNGIPPGSPHGLIYVIGHPDGQSKSVDGCAVIPQGEQGKKYRKHVQSGEAGACSPPLQYIYMHSQRSFRKVIHNPSVGTSIPTFYTGSSGSPVFDSKGSLVAMHTAGFPCEYEAGVSNIIEFGSTMEHILADIKENHEEWYIRECVIPQDVEMPSLEY